MTTPGGYLQTPYITPEILTSAPTGISWNSIPSGSQVTAQQRVAEQFNICQRATAIADGYCNQVLRSTPNVEFLQGPDYYATIQQATGNVRLIMSQWPVTGILSVQVSPNTFPRTFTAVPAGYWQPEVPAIDLSGRASPSGSAQGGQSIIVSPVSGGDWSLGRNGFVFQVQYTAGWPHTSLTADAAAGATTISVDDCTGWVITNPAGQLAGATGGVFDTQQEAVTPTASSVLSGPGTLTLSSPLLYAHQHSTMVSTMPQTIQWGCLLAATSIALTRGATATTSHTIPSGGGSQANKGPESLMQEAELLWHTYLRVI